MAWTTLCELSELTEGSGKCVDIEGFDLAVFLDQGEVRVIDNMCPHAGSDLASGPVMDGHVVCSRHGWPFDLKTGNLRGSTTCSVRTYQVRLHDANGKQFVQVLLPG